MCIQMYVGLEVCFLVYKCGCLSQSSHSIFVCLCLSVHSFLFHWIWSMPFWVDLLARKFQDIYLLYLPLQCWGYAQLLCGCWRSEVRSCCLGNRYPPKLLFSPLETVYKQAFKSRCSGVRCAYFPYSCIQLFWWRQWLLGRSQTSTNQRPFNRSIQIYEPYVFLRHIPQNQFSLQLVPIFPYLHFFR